MQRRQIGAVVVDLLGDAVHGRDRFDRILARCRFRGQHDGVGAVKDGGGDVGDLGARRHRAGDHRFQHLGGDHDRLAGAATRACHLFLHAGNPFQRHFHTQVAPRDHERVSYFENVAKPRHSVRLLDLGPHGGATAGELLRLGDILRALNERQRDPIDAGVESGFEVSNVFRCQRRERQHRIRQADALAV